MITKCRLIFVKLILLDQLDYKVCLALKYIALVANIKGLRIRETRGNTFKSLIGEIQ
jgi:hypothetical protein